MLDQLTIERAEAAAGQGPLLLALSGGGDSRKDGIYWALTLMACLCGLLSWRQFRPKDDHRQRRLIANWRSARPDR